MMPPMQPIPINEKLVWDYDIPEDAQESETFLRWYVTRVLTHGTAADIRAVGVSTIHDYLPHVFLPREIHDFWSWYFSLPHVKERYGDLDPIPTAIA